MKRAIVLTALLAACGHKPQPVAPDLVSDGNLHYVATSSTGQPILEGTIKIDVLYDSLVTGTWDIHWIPGVDTTQIVGAQIGSGELRGQKHADGMYVDLNPGYVDNNVVLLLTPAGNGYTGTWMWDTIGGPQASGGFEATEE